MRALFLTHAFPRWSGDHAGSFLLHLALALRAEGVEVSVLAPAGPDLPSSSRVDGIPVRRFRYAPHELETLAYTGTMVDQVRAGYAARAALLGLVSAGALAAAREARRLRVAVVHAHWWFPCGLSAIFAARLARRPLVTTLHGTDVRIARSNPALRTLCRRVLHGSAEVTTVSSWLAEQLQHIAPSIVAHVAPMPVDTTRFTPGGYRDPRRVLFVGRLTEQKGIRFLMQALPLLPPATTLEVIGDGPEREMLQRFAASAGLANRITWIAPLPQPALAAHYRSAAIVAVPSVDEGLGLVAAEAQLCATPVVAANSGGLRDIVEDGLTGVLAAPRDPGALARAIGGLLDDPARREALGAAGRAHAIATFAPGSVARRYAEIYRQAARNA